jgi:hypothetical protein
MRHPDLVPDEVALDQGQAPRVVLVEPPRDEVRDGRALDKRIEATWYQVGRLLADQLVPCIADLSVRSLCARLSVVNHVGRRERRSGRVG